LIKPRSPNVTGGRGFFALPGKNGGDSDFRGQQRANKARYLGHLEQGRKRGALYEDGGTHKIIDSSEWTVVPNNHEPIISQELFDRANSVITARTAEYKSRAGKYSEYEKPDILLADLVFCADCGKPLFRYKQVKSKYNRVYWTYQCRSHNTLLNCPHKYIHEKDLYSAVYESIRVEIERCCAIMQIVDKLNRESSHKVKLTRFDTEIEEAQRELRRIDSLRQAIYENYASKIITLSEYQYATEKYTSDTEKQRERLRIAEREKTAYAQKATPENKWLAAFTKFADEKELTADLAKAMIERIEVSNRDVVEVGFKFRDEYAAVEEYTGYSYSEVS